MLRPLGLAVAIFATVFSTSAVAQEKCYTDGKKTLTDWEASNNSELNYWADQMEKTRAKGQDPNSTMTTYNGLQMPVGAAYLIVHAKYDSASKAEVDTVVDKMRQCAKDVALPREAYDVVRKMLGFDTLLPEAVTRVDFAELKAGNIYGGKDALVPKGLEDARKAAEKALEDVRKAGDKAGKNVNDAFNKAKNDVIHAADPKELEILAPAWRIRIVCQHKCVEPERSNLENLGRLPNAR